MSNAKRTKLILVLLLTLLASIFMTAVMNVKNDVFASSDIKTVSGVTYTMETGASIYTNDDDDRMGIRFGAYMSESDYLALRNNVGTGKAYNSIMFGVIIAPASYEDTYKFEKMNLFGIDDNGNQTDGAKYDWAIWNGTSWEYSGNKTQVINIEQTRPQVKDGKVSVIGAITTIKPSSLLTNFKGVAYIIAEKQDGTFDVKFATENDNVRNTVYVAQRTYQANLTQMGTLDPENDAFKRLERENNTLATNYITDTVKSTAVSYSIEHYYKKPVGDGYFLFETTTGMGTINADLTAKNKDSTDVLGVTFDADNDNNGSDPVIYAQDKSVVKLYYDVVYGEDADTNEKVFDISATEDYAIDSGIIAVYSSDMALIS
ncbi:MAG: hypothetical protein J6U92_00055, partial [Clostridia bacterium]|nr:hypothetical protein [Clostridia bacterium]